jgi:hypothetical protein
MWISDLWTETNGTNFRMAPTKIINLEPGYAEELQIYGKLNYCLIIIQLNKVYKSAIVY